MVELSALADSKHRIKDVADQMKRHALPELCRVILTSPDCMADKRVDTALDSALAVSCSVQRVAVCSL